MAKPFLKWVGGKSQLLSQLRKHIPSKFNNYYEPFIGGGALFFELEPERAFLNDLNSHLINTYKNVRDNLDELITELKKIETEYFILEPEERKDKYYVKRREYNQLKEENSAKKAALLIFLNKTGFNGMYRENPKGEFNIPHGRNGITSLYNEEQLKEASKLLKRSTLETHPYDVVISNAVEGDFIYLDPPYWPMTKTSNFTSYVGQDFVIEEQYILKNIIDGLKEKGCKVMLSNSNNDDVKKLYKEYNIYEVSANRFINCKPSGRGKITELVITSY
jgi:DNA adenine methylase